jgi:GPH family glycoside/pentoside/hexuronide:cation symporter
MNEYKELKGIRQVLFAVGHIGPGMLNQFITTWLLLYLTTGESVALSGTMVGIALLFGRVMDAIADPIAAQMSDTLRNKRFGRRLPFIILGAIPMILSFNLLWLTRSLGFSEILRFFWVFVWLNAFYFFYTVVVNPYFALLPEIAKDKNQRTFIQSFVALFGILGMGTAMGASGFLIDAFGFSIAGLILSLICVLVLLFPAFIIKPNPDFEIEATEYQSDNILLNVKSALENKTFRNYITGFSIFFLGFQLIQYNLAFVTTVILGLEKSRSSLLFIVSVVFGLLFIPVYNVLIRRLSPSKALKIAIFAYVAISILISSAFLVKGVNPMILGVVLMALLGFPYSGLMVIPNVIISEIIDDDYAQFKKRREALFFGVQGLINNSMIAIAALLVGVFHDLLGNSIEHPLGVISIGPIAAALSLVGLVVISRLHIRGEGK